jgi:hypothetical protein
MMVMVHQAFSPFIARQSDTGQHRQGLTYSIQSHETDY